MLPLRRAVLLAAAVLAAACGGSAPPDAAPSPGPVVQMPTALATPGPRAPIPDRRLLQPLTSLGPCASPPAAAGVQSVPGVVVPADAVLTSVQDVGPLTNVQGYIPMTPIQIRVFYQQSDDLTIVSVEDEVLESEVLADTAGGRLFVKSSAVCEEGSLFVAILSAPARSP